MAVRDGLFYLIPLFVSSMAFSSQYTFFYQNYLHSSEVTVYLRTNLGSISARLAFIVQQTGSSPTAVRVDGKICNESCAIDVNYGSLTTLTFDNDENNRIEFYQTTKGMLLYYGKCEQNVDQSRCRYKATENYKICICGRFTASCTNDELLHWGKSCSGSTQTTFVEDSKIPYAEAPTKAKFSGLMSAKRRLYHSHPTSKANQATTPMHAPSRSGSGSRGPPVTRFNGPTYPNAEGTETVTRDSTSTTITTSITVTTPTSTTLTKAASTEVTGKTAPTEPISTEATKKSSPTTHTKSPSTEATKESTPTTNTKSTATEVTRESTPTKPSTEATIRESTPTTNTELTLTGVTKESPPSKPSTEATIRESTPTTNTEPTLTGVTKESPPSKPSTEATTRESTPTTNTELTLTGVTKESTPTTNTKSTATAVTRDSTPTKPSTEATTRESTLTTNTESTLTGVTNVSIPTEIITTGTGTTSRNRPTSTPTRRSTTRSTTRRISTSGPRTTPRSTRRNTTHITYSSTDGTSTTDTSSTIAPSPQFPEETDDSPYPTEFENTTTDSENTFMTTNTEETSSTSTIFESTTMEQEVDLHNVTEVLNETLVYSENRTDLNADQIQEIAIILQKCANLSGIQPKDSQKVLLNIDYVLSANASEIANSSQVLLELIPMLVQNTNATSFDFLEGENLGFTATSVDCDAKEGIGILDTGSEFKTLESSTADDNKQHSIFISNADVCRRSSQDSQENMTDPAPSRCENQIALVDAAPIMSGTIIGNDQITSLDSSNATVMATLQFSLTNILRPLHGHFRVTWWNVTHLEWSETNQCKTTIEGGKLVATCNHLTDFALIVGGALDDPITCDKALYSVAYTVNSLSMVSLLFLTVISVSAYCPAVVGNHFLVYLRGYAPPTKDFVCLSHKASMFLFYLVFTVFSDESVSGNGCSVFASIAYMLLMSSILLTIFQALRLTTAFALLTGPWVKVVILPSPAIIISILPPFVASLLLATLSNFFHRDDSFCWVRPDYIFFGVIIPTTIMILNAIFCTTVICRRIFGRRKFSRSMRRRERTQIASKIGAVFLMQLSMGTPWALQYLALYKPTTTVWHYIFTIVMGSQGTMLAMLYLYKRQKSLYFYRGSYNLSRRTKEESLSE